jgi:hypothetical protein
MKWFWNRCNRRAEAGLLAADVLDGEQRRDLENHIAACEECRTYYGEIKIATAPLTGWEKSLSAIEATPVARNRWARALKEATPPAPACPQGPRSQEGFWRAVWRELIWPSRYVWSGLAALWVAMLVVNAQLSDHPTGRTLLRRRRSWRLGKNRIAYLLSGRTPTSLFPPRPPSFRIHAVKETRIGLSFDR